MKKNTWRWVDDDGGDEEAFFVSTSFFDGSVIHFFFCVFHNSKKTLYASGERSEPLVAAQEQHSRNATVKAVP